MRRINRVLSTSMVLATLAFAAAPTFATKPGQPPGQARHQAAAKADSGKKQPAAKTSSNRGGPERSASGKQSSFAASNVRRNDDRHDWRDRAYRDHWRDDDRRDWDRKDHHRDWDRDHDRWSRNDWHRDYGRYERHDPVRYYYPRPGYVVRRLPVKHRVVHYHGVPYYYGGGSWYRPQGSFFTVVAPPLGLMISFLPDGYTTLWIGGIPYYHANDVYYRWRPDRRAYIVTALPPGYY